MSADHDYSFFLFVKLYDVYHPSGEEYDRAYGRMAACYEAYTASEYNDPYKGEYDCMERFIKKLVTKVTDISMAEYGETIFGIPGSKSAIIIYPKP